MFGPTRSPTKAPYRSPTKALGLEIEAPEPPADTDFWPCHGHVAKAASPCSPPCQFLYVDCEGKGSSQYSWDYAFFFDWMVGNLSYKNLPMQVYRADGELLATVDFGCRDGTGWAIWSDSPPLRSYYHEPGSQDVEYDPWRDTRPPPGGFGEACSVYVNTNTPPSLIENELISFRTKKATWQISSISGERIFVEAIDGPLLLWDHSMLILRDTPGGINDLPVRVHEPSGGAEGSSVRVGGDDGQSPGLTDQGAGGVLEFLPGDWYSCTSYTTLEDVPFGIYDAILKSTPAIFEPDKVAILRLQNAGVYSGDYVGVIYVDSETVILPTKWIGYQLLGQWLNKAIRFTVPGIGVAGTITASVRGTLGLYDGIHTMIGPAADTLDIEDTWYQGTDSGKIVFADSYAEGSGIDENTFEPISIQISGTTSYDGIYFCLVSRDIGEPVATFIGGDFNGIYKEPTESGTWAEVGGLGRSGNITVMPVFPAEDFTAVAPQLSGDIDSIGTGLFRINCSAPDANVDDWARIFSYDSNRLVAQLQYYVRGVGADYVDVEGIIPDPHSPNGNVTFSRRRS